MLVYCLLVFCFFVCFGCHCLLFFLLCDVVVDVLCSFAVCVFFVCVLIGVVAYVFFSFLSISFVA